MSESSERRAEELEQRLQDQPGSRLFVQLAEEYRRLERYDDAVRTLEKGLEDQPTYLSARVLLGRCLLESGDAPGAVPELEKVLRQDQTHLLAHKLLAEAHLETGDLDSAGQRLDLYEMLNESDPEIEELRARLRSGAGAASEPEPAAPPPAPEPPAPRETSGSASDEDLFDLGAPQPRATPREDEDLLGVWEAGPEPTPEPAPPVEETPAAPEPPAPAEPPDAEASEDPFGDLWSPEDRERLETGFAAEGLFAEPPMQGQEQRRDVVEAREAPEPEAAHVPTEAEPREATVTLGRLYLQQGHEDEARRIFREILDREPDHETARAELLRLEAPAPDVGFEPAPELESRVVEPEPPAPEPEPEPAVEPEAAFEPEPPRPAPPALTAADLEEPGAGSLGLTERKVRMLDHYLQRIRQAAEHVR